MTLHHIEREALRLPKQERLRLARQLLDSLLQAEPSSPDDGEQKSSPLSAFVGMFDSGKPIDTAANASRIVAEELDHKYPQQ